MTAPLPVEVLSDLIGSIYDCALDPQRWPAALTELRLALGFHNAALSPMTVPVGGILLNVTSGIEPSWLERMAQYGADVVEQWGGAEAINSYPLDEPAVLSQKRSPSEMYGNRYFREWAQPQGLTDVLAVALARDGGIIGSVGFGRHLSAGAIGAREVDAARLLIPHLQRAVAISKVLDLKTVVAAWFQAALDALAAAVVLVAADLRIVHANKAAQRMLDAGDPIAEERGVLAVRSRAANAALAVAVRQAAEAESAMGRRGFGIPAADGGGGPAVLHVLPLAHGAVRPGLAPNAAAAVFVAPAAVAAPAPSEALTALFDLTAAEARVLVHLAAGKTLAETARALRVGPSTARTHLLRLFAKTGTGRQAELLKLVDSLSAPI